MHCSCSHSLPRWLRFCSSCMVLGRKCLGHNHDAAVDATRRWTWQRFSSEFVYLADRPDEGYVYLSRSTVQEVPCHGWIQCCLIFGFLDLVVAVPFALLVPYSSHFRQKSPSWRKLSDIACWQPVRAVNVKPGRLLAAKPRWRHDDWRD
jgi:hypothetical protein